MKKILTVAILLFASVLTYACTDKAQAQQKARMEQKHNPMNRNKKKPRAEK